MEMKSLTEDERTGIATAIVRDFGNGILRSDKSLLNQITKAPPGHSWGHVTRNEAMSLIDQPRVYVIFDPEVQNQKFVAEVAKSLGLPDAPGYVLPKERINDFLKCENCDMFFTTSDGHLIFVGCHEDPVIQGERLVSAPVASQM
jgi:hypothetical protein